MKTFMQTGRCTCYTLTDWECYFYRLNDILVRNHHDHGNSRLCVRYRICNHCHSKRCTPKIRCSDDRLRNELMRLCLMNVFLFY